MPLLIHFTYSLSVVTARISGWRFIMPVDWIPQMYYSIGLIQLVLMLASVVWNRKTVEEETSVEASPSFFQRKTYISHRGLPADRFVLAADGNGSARALSLHDAE